MSEGGTAKKALEEATEELQKELNEWEQTKLDPFGYRMNEQSLQIRCEILVLTEVLKEHLGLSEDYINAKLRRILCEQLRLLRPVVEEMRSAEMRKAITDGVVPKGKVIQLKPDIKL
jgi:hypothetical protein